MVEYIRKSIHLIGCIKRRKIAATSLSESRKLGSIVLLLFVNSIFKFNSLGDCIFVNKLYLDITLVDVYQWRSQDFSEGEAIVTTQL